MAFFFVSYFPVESEKEPEIFYKMFGVCRCCSIRRWGLLVFPFAGYGGEERTTRGGR